MKEKFIEQLNITLYDKPYFSSFFSWISSLVNNKISSLFCEFVMRYRNPSRIKDFNDHLPLTSFPEIDPIIQTILIVLPIGWNLLQPDRC